MSDVIIPQTWLGNNRLILVHGEDGRIFLWTPLALEGEEIVLEIVPLSQIQALESTADQVSKALCGKENASPDELLKAVDQLESRLAQVERERDAAVRAISDAKHYIKDLGAISYGLQQLENWDYSIKKSGVCAENTKEAGQDGNDQ